MALVFSGEYNPINQGNRIVFQNAHVAAAITTAAKQNL
jgi:hypothetical protein